MCSCHCEADGKREPYVSAAAGLASPLSGGGNIPAMLSALSLASNLGSPKQYEREMVRRFGYFRIEAKVISSFLAGRVITPRNIIARIRMFRFVGIYPTFPQYWQIIEAINYRLAKSPKCDRLENKPNWPKGGDELASSSGSPLNYFGRYEDGYWPKIHRTVPEWRQC